VFDFQFRITVLELIRNKIFKSTRQVMNFTLSDDTVFIYKLYAYGIIILKMCHIKY